MGHLRISTGYLVARIALLAVFIHLCNGQAALAAGMLPALSGADSRIMAQADAPATPLLNSAGHRLAEGDYLLAQFSDGQQQEEYYLQVDSAGEIRMPLIDSVRIAGLVPREAADLLTEQYRTYYRQPYVSLQVLSLGQFDVFVFGADFPGKIYTLNNGTDLLGLLTTLGLNDAALYRRIHVVRGEFDFDRVALRSGEPPAVSAQQDTGLIETPSPAVVTRNHESLAGLTNWRAWIEACRNNPACSVWVVDPLQITVEGELSRHNIELQPRDVIYVPTPERFVDINGVAKPGRYELLEGEDLGTVLRLAGTVNYSADLMNTVIRRLDEQGRLERLIFNLYPTLDDPSLIESFPLENRDVINIAVREERIFVLGEVNAAGAFSFREDSTVLDYLAEAGGETAQANLAWIAVIRQGRDRLNPQIPSDVIQANFKELHKGLPLCEDLSLLPGDVIYVPPKGFSFEMPQIIQAVGAAVTSFAIVRDTLKSSEE